MAKAKSYSSTARGVIKSKCAKSTPKTTQKRAKEDGESDERQYKNYAQSSSSDDSETELKIAGGADRQHAMYSEGSSGAPYMRQQSKYGEKRRRRRQRRIAT